MTKTLIRSVSAILLVLTVAACSGAARTPAASAPSTDVNPITGSRGGSGSR